MRDRERLVLGKTRLFFSSMDSLSLLCEPLCARARVNETEFATHQSFLSQSQGEEEIEEKEKNLLFLSDFRTFFYFISSSPPITHGHVFRNLLNSCWNYSKGDDRWFCHLVSKQQIVVQQTKTVLTRKPSLFHWRHYRQAPFTHKSLKLPFVIWLKRRSRRSFIWLIRCCLALFQYFRSSGGKWTNFFTHSLLCSAFLLLFMWSAAGMLRKSVFCFRC